MSASTSRTAVSRKPGRPPASSAPGQRERLLDAAFAHYAQHGIAAARLRHIAAAARVAPALIGYYFGSRDALRDAVVAERLLPVIAGLRAPLQAANTSPPALVQAFVAAVHAAVREQPALPALWVREVLTEGGALRPLLLERIAPQIPQALAHRFAAAQRRGEIHPAIDPRLLVVSMIGLTLFPLAAAPIWRQAFAAADIDDAALQTHTVGLLQRALEAR